MNTTPTTRTQDQQRTDTLYRVRELSERPEFDEEVERKVRWLRYHSIVALTDELRAWKTIFEEELNYGDASQAMHALASIQAIGKELTERGAW